VTDRRLLFFGDSLVAGVGDPSGRGWVGRIVAASFGSGLPMTAYNLGVRGDTSLQVAARWRAEAQPRLLTGADTRIAVSFGANDTTIEDGRLRTEPAESSAALGDILAGAASLGLSALVIGPAPVDDPEQNQRIQALSSMFSRVCLDASVRFVSIFETLLADPTWMSQVRQGDGAHPSAEGYDALANLILAEGWTDWLRATLVARTAAGG
jgi:lysophospholipase L1-like esterase